MGVRSQLQARAALPPEETSDCTYRIGGWVCPIVGQDVMEKTILPMLGIEPQFLGRPARSLISISTACIQD
jgi:hypothetical protein